MSEDHDAAIAARQRERLVDFAARYGASLGHSPGPVTHDGPRVLSISSAPPLTEVEVCLLRALSRAGCSIHPMVMMQPELVRPYYELINPTDIRDWRSYWDVTPELLESAGALLAGCDGPEGLLGIRSGPVRTGGHALALARRHLRTGTPDLSDAGVRHQVRYFLAASMAAASGIQRVLDEVRPSIVLAIDTAYSPKGEILDTCAARGIPFIRWYPAHKSNTLMLKRYHAANADHDLMSLSESTWMRAKSMRWDPAYRQEVTEEIQRAYEAGDWYSESGTQFNTRALGGSAVREVLGLDATRKAAFIFPHIAWDASFGRGEDLFASYEAWLLETIRAAIANDSVQWVIKVHPAHVGKGRIDDWGQLPSEEALIQAHFPALPGHIKVLPADCGISTYSLFPVMDYCLTVRGTVGLEAARLGIPVLTGGTGRYDRRGFTIDSATREEYLARINRLLDVGPLEPGQVELADRYAYALFRMRPLPLTSLSLDYHLSHGASHAFNQVRVMLQSEEDWASASDLNAFAQWAMGSSDEDYVR